MGITSTYLIHFQLHILSTIKKAHTQIEQKIQQYKKN
jgi:hypothetical protein